MTTQQSSIEKVELFQGTNKLFSSLSGPSCFWVTDGRRWRSRASGWKGWSYLQVGEKMLTLLWKTTPDIQFNITNIWDTLSWSLNNAYLFDGVLISLLNFFLPNLCKASYNSEHKLLLVQSHMRGCTLHWPCWKKGELNKTLYLMLEWLGPWNPFILSVNVILRSR